MQDFENVVNDNKVNDTTLKDSKIETDTTTGKPYESGSSSCAVSNNGEQSSTGAIIFLIFAIIFLFKMILRKKVKA